MIKKVVVGISLLFIVGIVFSNESEKNIIVKIGKQTFTLKDFEESLNQTKINLNTLSPDFKKRMLDQFVREKLFAAAAKNTKTTMTEEQEKNLERFRQMYLISNYINKLMKESPVTDTEIKQTYDRAPNQYRKPERRKLRHIIVSDEEKAKEILQKLKNGANFEELASQNNIDATKQRGGDLNWAQKGIFVKEFEDVAFSLKKGEISGIVKTQFGYHIVRVDDIEESKQRTFPEVQQEIRRKLEEQKILNLEQQLKKKYNVQVDYSLLESLKSGN